jgi:hypothetical protein
VKCNLVLFLIAVITGANANAVAPTFKTTAEGDIGFVAQVSGDVKIDGLPIKSGAKLKIGSNIQTGVDGKLQLFIGQGIVAAVGFDSKVKVEKFEKKSVSKIPTESAQVELARGSLRCLVNQSSGVVRIATVRSGDAFGVVKDGEAHFLCNEACAQKYEESVSKKTKGSL